MRRPARDLSWTLVRDDGVPVARLVRIDFDQPWFVCDFTPEPGFGPDWEEAEDVFILVDDATDDRIQPFLLRVDGDAAYLRI